MNNLPKIPQVLNNFLNPMPKSQLAIDQKPKGPLTVSDLISPPAIEVDFDHIKINEWYYRTLFVAGYPRFVSANWLEPLISFNHTLDISMYVYPTRSEEILENLKRKVGEMEATIQSDLKRGRVIEPSVQIALEDALGLQQELAKGSERFFQFGLYITIPARTLEDLDKTTKQIEATLGSLLIVTKKSILTMEEGFKTTLPMGRDRIIVTRNMDTTSLATTFPFTTSELTANEGILYGINEHNESLIIFDRFTLENANSVVFGKSGGGKSYMVKLEVMRSLMFDTEVIIIDPENEYETLALAQGGEYIRFKFGSNTKINPFDLALLGRDQTEESELSQKILSLHGFFRVVMGNLTPSEDALLDRALILTYKQKGITPDPSTHSFEPPLMEDLYKVLLGMEEALAKGLADRIEKFVKGSLVGIFDQQTNVAIRSQLTVFSIRDLEDEIRPIAMYLILDFIWNKIRHDKKRRLLIVDEAWYLMKYPDSAQFLYGIAKRARKYYLGLTTITQDVEDFLATEMGKAIIQNSSMQILLKQSSAAIEKVADVFYLSEGEQHLLLSAAIGQGLFFAGPAHAAMRVIASPDEHALITTKPQETLGTGVKEQGSATQETQKIQVPLRPAQQEFAGQTAQAIENKQAARDDNSIIQNKPIQNSSVQTPQRINRPIFTVEPIPADTGLK
jgi:conjugal transfer ATP-binding protein TraC